MLALYPVSVHAVWSMAAMAGLIGAGGGISTNMQARLIDVAGDAQAMAAALNQSAFNLADSFGPWLGGLTISSGSTA